MVAIKLKTFERRRCGHLEVLKSSYDSISCMANIGYQNKHRYVVATQDRQLRRLMPKTDGILLMYINRSVMTLESIYQKTKSYKTEIDSG
jgi:U3 small nucleolar RNA-associated protein 23